MKSNDPSIFFTSVLIFVTFAATASAGQNYWPAFKGRYAITSWNCQSNYKDDGCRASSLLEITEVRGLMRISIYDKSGRMIRSNDLTEKTGGPVQYSFVGTPDAPGFLAEGYDSNGSRFFANLFTLAKQGNGFVFRQEQESSQAGFNNKILREFALTPE